MLDVASLRQLTPAALKASATLLAPVPAVRWRPAPEPVNVYAPMFGGPAVTAWHSLN